MTAADTPTWAACFKIFKTGQCRVAISSDLCCFVSLHILHRRYISIHRCLIHKYISWGLEEGCLQVSRQLGLFSHFFHHCAMRLETSAPSFDEGEVQICWSSNILGSDETIIHSWSSTAWRKHVKKYQKVHNYTNYTYYKHASKYQIDGF